MDTERMFTQLELRQYDGDLAPAYVAFNGVVYDLSNCPHWRNGLHQSFHFPGQDLSAEIEAAPHGAEVFHHPCARAVGRLQPDC